jgi:hypothetical protein
VELLERKDKAISKEVVLMKSYASLMECVQVITVRNHHIIVIINTIKALSKSGLKFELLMLQLKRVRWPHKPQTVALRMSVLMVVVVRIFCMINIDNYSSIFALNCVFSQP